MAPAVFARIETVDVIILTRHVIDTDLRVADTARGEVVRVQGRSGGGGGGPAVESLPVGAVAGAEEEVGAGGPAVAEDGFEEVVEVFVGVGEVSEGEGAVGVGVVPPGAADAVLIVAVALDEGGCGE